MVVRTLLLSLCFIAMTPLRQAQDKLNAEETPNNSKWHFTARVGYGIGGTIPLGMPVEMRQLNGYSPKFNYSIGGEAERTLNDKFGIQAGVYLQRKAFSTDVTMRQYYMTLQRGGQSISGPYTGNVYINIEQNCITIPLQMSYWINDHAKLAFGPYFSFIVGRTLEGYAYGNKVYEADGSWAGKYDAYLRSGDSRGQKVYIGNVETDSKGVTTDSRGKFGGEDFDNYMHKFQWGLDVDFDYYFGRHFGAFADLSYGINKAFTDAKGSPVNMGLHQLYFTVGIAYKFK